MRKNKLNFELLGDQRINSKIPSVHKMWPICKLEALNHVKGRTAFETGHSSRGGGPGSSIQACGLLWTLPGPPCFLAHISLFSLGLTWMLSWCSVLYCLFSGSAAASWLQSMWSGSFFSPLPRCAALFWLPGHHTAFLASSKLKLVSPLKPRLVS